jgi:hypothetical protein
MKIIALGADPAAPVHEDDHIPLIATGRPVASGAPTPEPGLFFRSCKVPPDGQLHATSRKALAIAQHAGTLTRKAAS